MIVLYFVITDRGAQFYEAIITYNQNYAGSIVENIFRGMSPSALWPPMMNFSLPLVLAGVLAWSLNPGLEKDRLLIIIYGICVVLLIASPGRFFSYYYQLWLPVLALFGAEIIFYIEHKFPKHKLAMNLAGVIIVLTLLSFQIRYFEWTPMEWARYKDDGFVDYPQAAKTIDRLLQPDETFSCGDRDPHFTFTHSGIPQCAL